MSGLHLLHEDALERQATLQPDSRVEWDDGYSDEEVERKVHPGDTVRFLFGDRKRSDPDDNSDPTEVLGVALDMEDVVLRNMDYHHAEGMIPVWLCAPCFCGNPQDLIRITSEDVLQVLERPCDPNTSVSVLHTSKKVGNVDGDEGEEQRTGVVCSNSIQFRGLPLASILKFHSSRRYASSQYTLGHVMSRYDGPNSFRYLAQGVDSLQRSMRDLASFSGGSFISGSGDRFVRGNPFPIGRFVRSHRNVLDPPTPQQAPALPNVGNEIVPTTSLSMNSSNHADPPQNRLDDNPAEAIRVPFFGHVHSVDFACLVELFLPPPPQFDKKRRAKQRDEQRQDACEGPMSFLVLVPSSVVATSTCESQQDRKLLIRNVHHRSSHDRTDRGDEPSVAPPHLDVVAPLMYVEDIRFSTLEHEVVWCRGTFDDYRTACIARLSRGADVLGNGIVVFAFPEKVTALELMDGFPMEFRAHEIMPMETDGNDHCMIGQHGFVVDLEASGLSAPPEPSREPPALDPVSQTLRDSLKNRASVSLAAANDMYRWYQSHGIIPCKEGESWVLRLSKLLPMMTSLVVITRVWSTAHVVWNTEIHDSGNTRLGEDVSGEVGDSLVDVGTTPSYQLVPRERVDRGEVAALDIVVPSPLYEREKLVTCRNALQRSAFDPQFLVEDRECSCFDVVRVHEANTDLQVSESVRPRLHREPYFIAPNGEETDPEILGFVLRSDVASGICSVRWFLQPQCEAELITRRPTDVGQIMELLPNTLVRVRWSRGDVEDCPREQLMPCREYFDDDEEEEEEEDEEDEEAYDEGIVEEQPPAEPEAGHSEGNRSGGGEVAPAHSTVQKVQNVIRAFAQAFSAVLPSSSTTPKAEAQAPPLPDLDRPAEAPTRAEEKQHQESLDRIAALENVGLFASHLFAAELDAIASATRTAASERLFSRRIQWEWQDMASRLSTLDPVVVSVPNGNPSVLSPVQVKICREMPRVLKFAIIGPMHTPYYQSLLCFDVCLGEDFPIGPPMARFHALNVRLNPNLYDDGYICLSLLGTWNGQHASETWNPATSSLMQLILSIQSLVLVKEPYYNEAGYEDFRGSPQARAASKSYNESLALIRLQHLMDSAERAPSDWMFAIRRHVRLVGPLIFQRLTKLLNEQEAQQPVAAAAAGLDDTTSKTEGSITADGLVLPLTKGFMITLRRALTLFQSFMNRKFPEWQAEEDAVSLTHLDDDPR